jgi:hypothetical protein
MLADYGRPLRNALRASSSLVGASLMTCLSRSGTPCRSPAVIGRRRCRMHGGARGSGGPKGQRNGNYKHGRYTAEAIASRRWLRQLMRDVRALAKRMRQP